MFTRAIAIAIAHAIAGCGGADPRPSKPAPEPVSITDLEAAGVRQIDALIAVANNAEHPQRAGAIRALGRVGDDRAVDALIAIAGDGDTEVRAAVARSLGIASLMGASADPIVAALVARWKAETDARARAALAIALGRGGDERAVAPLVAGLAAADHQVADDAALALGLLGRREVAIDDAARRALVELAGRAAHRYAATYALAREHQPPVDPVVVRVLEALAADTDAEVRTLALTGLARRRRGRARFAAALDDPDWRVAIAAIAGLSALANDAATGDLARWLTAIDPLEANPMVVRAALRALLDRADLAAARTAASAVLRKVRSAPPNLDRSQIECLAAAVATPASALLQSCGAGAPSWWRAALIAELVAKHPTPAAEKMGLLARLHAPEDPRVRAAVLTGMTGLAANLDVRAQVIDAIARGLADPSEAVAGTAADAIAGLALTDRESGPVFAALVERGAAALEGDAELGLTIVNAIAASHVAAGEPVCRAARGHRNRAVRRAGRACLEVLAGADPGPGTPGPLAPLPHRPKATPLRWTVETSRGTVAIDLDPAAAPWHVAAIAGLTRAGFYDGLLFHRVVPGFVTQGGDPTGTGWGGPGFALPPEPSDRPFARGVVGIADAGPGTGGCQWFVMHARAPHLEGRYTAVGEVVSGLEVFDAIAVGDRIIKATIAARPRSGSPPAPPPPRSRRR